MHDSFSSATTNLSENSNLVGFRKYSDGEYEFACFLITVDYWSYSFHNSLWMYAFQQGNFTEATEQFKTLGGLFTVETHHEITGSFGGCGGFYAHAFNPYCLLVLGQVEEAVQSSLEILDLAEQLEHPYTLTLSRVLAMMMAYELEDIERVHELAEEIISVSERYGLGLMLPLGQIGKGWAMARLMPKNADESARLIDLGTHGFAASGVVTNLAHWLSWKADILLHLEKPKEALQTITRALALNATDSLDHYYDSALHRMRAQALHALGTHCRG